MTRFFLTRPALPLFALALLALVVTSAAAQQDETGGHADVQAEKPHPQPRTYLTSEELDALEPMSQEERQSFFTRRRAENEALSDEDRQAKREGRRAAFDALPAAEQATIKERTQRLIDGLHTGAPRSPAAGEDAAKKETADFMRSLTPEQKAIWDAIKKNNQKWAKAQKKPKE